MLGFKILQNYVTNLSSKWCGANNSSSAWRGLELMRRIVNKLIHPQIRTIHRVMLMSICNCCIPRLCLLFVFLCVRIQEEDLLSWRTKDLILVLGILERKDRRLSPNLSLLLIEKVSHLGISLLCYFLFSGESIYNIL